MLNSLSQPLFGALFGPHGPVNIDLSTKFGTFNKKGNLVVRYLAESTADHQGFTFPSLLVGQRPNLDG